MLFRNIDCERAQKFYLKSSSFCHPLDCAARGGRTARPPPQLRHYIIDTWQTQTKPDIRKTTYCSKYVTLKKPQYCKHRHWKFIFGLRLASALPQDQPPSDPRLPEMQPSDNVVWPWNSVKVPYMPFQQQGILPHRSNCCARNKVTVIQVTAHATSRRSIGTALRRDSPIEKRPNAYKIK